MLGEAEGCSKEDFLIDLHFGRPPTRPNLHLLPSQWECAIILLLVGQMRGAVAMPSLSKQKKDVQQGTLALMVLKTLDVLGPQHGYGIARRIEQISGDLLSVNQGTLYPVLLRLEQEGAVKSDWGPSENNRRARFYRLTRAGRKLLESEKREWEQTAAIIARFFEVKAEDLA
jgi:transcriptional regulator